MTRVLHILDRAADFQTRQTHACIVRDAGDAFDTCTFDLSDFLVGISRASVALRKRRGEFDVVHAWGIPALLAAVVAGFSRIVVSPNVWIGRAGARWLRAVRRYRPGLVIVCPSEGQRRMLTEVSVPVAACQVIRPGVDVGGGVVRRDDVLRTKLGFTSDDFVMLAVGESTRSAAHADAVWAAGILNVLEPREKLLLWGKGPVAEHADEFARRLSQPGLGRLATSILGDIDFGALLPVADVVLLTPRGPVATLPIAMAMAMGVPIVSTVTPLTTELLEDNKTALMVMNRSPRAIARRVMDLKDDSELGLRISNAAQAEAAEKFDLARMIDAYRSIYSQVGARQHSNQV